MYKAKTAEEWASMIDPVTLQLLPEFEPPKTKAKVQVPPYMRVIEGGKSARATKPQAVPARTRPTQLAFNF